jgi:plasmid stabilization system protein ParE
MRLRYTAEANQHIDAIYDYIAERSPVAATDVVRRIRAAAERLREFPHMGHIGIVPTAREWVVKGLPYVIVHEVNVNEDEVLIIAIFHGAQDRTHGISGRE